MSAYDDILGSLPVDELAGRLDASPDEIRQAAAAAVPALLGGLDANAHAGGAGSLLDALGSHDQELLSGGTQLSAIDERDGDKIVSHVFGDQRDDVVARLGGSPLSGEGVGPSLMKKLLPILAPMVLSWLAKQVLGGGGRASTGAASGGGPASGGGLQDILGQVLGGATGGAGRGGASGRPPTSGGVDTGAIIGDLLGGILGGGRR